MTFSGCSTRLVVGGYWSYCGCADCGLRRKADRRNGLEEAVLKAMVQAGLSDPESAP